jgi:hypothetical protein
MNTNTMISRRAIADPADADEVEPLVDTEADPSAAVTTCSEVDSHNGAVDVFVEATYEQPFWSCSKSHRATATRSSRS